MRLLVLSEHDVRALLTMRECVGVMEEAFRALASGEVYNPLRQAIRPPGSQGLLGLMPAWRGGSKPYFGLKEVAVFPENPLRGLDTHLGAVILHSGDTGEPLAIMNAATITAIRTGAVSALATRLLAREGAAVLAILGAGVQARAHLEAIPLVRDVVEVRIFSRGGGAAALAGTHAGRQRMIVSRSAEEAIRGADIIVTATSSVTPVLVREWVSDGAHINAVGASVASSRELDGATVASSRLFVDRRESTTHESGDFLGAIREGLISGAEHIEAELGEVLTGAHPGRRSDSEVTVFKSLGLAAEDLFAASFVYEKALSAGRGQWVEF